MYTLQRFACLPFSFLSCKCSSSLPAGLLAFLFSCLYTLQFDSLISRLVFYEQSCYFRTCFPAFSFAHILAGCLLGSLLTFLFTCICRPIFLIYYITHSCILLAYLVALSLACFLVFLLLALQHSHLQAILLLACIVLYIH